MAQLCASRCARRMLALEDTPAVTSCLAAWPLPTYQEMLFVR